MKALLKVIATASALLVSAISFAQSTTRADVKADLERIEQAGFNPAVASDPYYPADMQAAQARNQAGITRYDGTEYPLQPGALMNGNATNVDYVPVQ
ncbi:hypothetical protein ABH945_005789 [Paraburkholderia sp. GAS333]|uniref:DUF4148 domain-containing protein n=1 Tax=Paraburkholderia sp. GAS333 TaxID=3156279 RepID=UPI003D1ACF87